VVWLAMGFAALMALAMLDDPKPQRARVVQVSLAPAGAQAEEPAPSPDAPVPLDPAAWGEDHVGLPLPSYVEGGECLFCHRNEVGHDWQTNRHARDTRDAAIDDPAVKALAGKSETQDLAAEVALLLGGNRAVRFLKPGSENNHLDLLSVVARRGRGQGMRLTEMENPHWDAERFGQRCAGCHATAVDPETTAYSSLSMDCYVCHGDAPLEHANESELMPLAKKRHDSAAVVTSICAQCHIRFGKSRSTGRPYPNNFVAGDNLFRDFEVDWAKADDPEVNPNDRHVLANARDVVLHGREEITCLSCHDVHKSSAKKHRELPETAYCRHCHEAGKPLTEFLRYDVHSPLCEY